MTKRAKPDAQEREIMKNYNRKLKSIDAERDAITQIYTKIRDLTSYSIDMNNEEIQSLIKEIGEYTASGYRNVNELDDAEYLHGPYSEDHHKRLWLMISCLPDHLLRSCSERTAKYSKGNPWLWKVWIARSGKWFYLPATIFSPIFHFTSYYKFELSEVGEKSS